MDGITISVIKLDTNTIRLDWTIPLASMDPLATPCSGYYTNYSQTTSIPPLDLPNWDVVPIVIVTEPEFNCEISRLFIYRNNNNHI